MKKQPITIIESERSQMIELIKKNILKGDIPELAKKNNLKKQDFYNVTKGNSFRKDIIKLLYEKALDNRSQLKAQIESLK